MPIFFFVTFDLAEAVLASVFIVSTMI